MIVRNEAARIVRALASAPAASTRWSCSTPAPPTPPSRSRAPRARASGTSTGATTSPPPATPRSKLADADWNVVIDADEWIAEAGIELLALRHTAPDFVGTLRVDSHFDTPLGLSTSPSWLPRVLPRGVRYAGHVHEQPVHEQAGARLTTVLAHDGYRADALKAKAGRNADLLARALAQAPDDAYLHYQIGKDHDVYERYADACAHFARSRACEDASGATVTLAGATPGWHHDRLVREIHALKKCRRHAEAVLLAEGSMADLAALARLLLRARRPAAGLGDRGADARRRAAADDRVGVAALPGDRRAPDLEGSVAGRGSALAARNLAVLYEGTGRAIEALKLQPGALSDGFHAGRGSSPGANCRARPPLFEA
jgi:hypothetical protein